MLPLAVTRHWTHGGAIVAGGAVVALAASAETAWSLRVRFALDLEGLSALERAGVALWDFRPLATAVFAGAALAVLLAPAGAAARAGIAVLAAAHAALAAVVLVFAVWIAAAGEVGGADALGFAYPPGERAVTLVTQLAAWLPLAVLLTWIAVVAARTPSDTVLLASEAPASAAAQTTSLSEEMGALWTERLAFSPKRERARTLLERIRALEASGDVAGARELAEEMRRLYAGSCARAADAEGLASLDREPELHPLVGVVRDGARSARAAAPCGSAACGGGRRAASAASLQRQPESSRAARESSSRPFPAAGPSTRSTNASSAASGRLSRSSSEPRSR